jgi:hypothetical protein
LRRVTDRVCRRGRLDRSRTCDFRHSGRPCVAPAPGAESGAAPATETPGEAKRTSRRTERLTTLGGKIERSTRRCQGKLIPKALLVDSWGIPESLDPDSRRRGGFGHAIIDQASGRLFLGGWPAVEDRQPEPAASVAGCGQGRNGSRRGGESWRHGPARPCATGFIASMPRVLRVPRPLDRRSQASPFGGALAQLAQIVEVGPDREKDGVARWRRIDLKRVIAERFGVDFHPHYVGSFCTSSASPTSARPAPSGSGSAARRGLQKNFPRALKAHREGLPETTPVEIWFEDVPR